MEIILNFSSRYLLNDGIIEWRRNIKVDLI